MWIWMDLGRISVILGPLVVMPVGLGETNTYMFKTMLDHISREATLRIRCKIIHLPCDECMSSWNRSSLLKRLDGCLLAPRLLRSMWTVFVAKNILGCGGAIHDERGNWVCGFSKFIGFCNTFMAEVWRVYEGLKLTFPRGFGGVIVNTDSKWLISAILQVENNGDSNLTLISQIHMLMAKHDVVMINNSFQKTNCVVEKLTKIKRSLKNDYKCFEKAFEFLKSLL